jgi:hypothetical protein
VSIYPFIEAEKAQRHSVKRACELLQVSRAAFCQHLSGPSRRERDDTELAAQITAVHQESKGRYGAPRVHAQLARDGRRHGRKRRPDHTRPWPAGPGGQTMEADHDRWPRPSVRQISQSWSDARA